MQVSTRLEGSHLRRCLCGRATGAAARRGAGRMAPPPRASPRMEAHPAAGQMWSAVAAAALSAACMLPVASLPAAPAAAAAARAPIAPGTSPYEDAKRVVYGPTADGYIRACLGATNPNCVSTASTNDQYGAAWRANESSAAAAAEVLELGVAQLLPEAKLVQKASLKGGEYRAFATEGLYGLDVMEFLIKPDGVGNRSWEGDAPGVLVTYRSQSGGVKYIWPIQQPLSDFGAQRKRLQELRQELGWAVVGCELLECYQ